MGLQIKLWSWWYTWASQSTLSCKRIYSTRRCRLCSTFSPMAKLVTIKLLLALSAIHDWHLIQLDVNNVFFHGDLTEDVYMCLPQGYHREGKTSPNTVCKLHKSIYGLNQALRQWFAKFSSVLLRKGFTQSSSDHSFFIKYNANSFVAVLLYVDHDLPTMILMVVQILNVFLIVNSSLRTSDNSNTFLVLKWPSQRRESLLARDSMHAL